MRRFLYGFWLIFTLALSFVWKRLLILVIGFLIGFGGPLLSLQKLPGLHDGGDWFWDAVAADMNQAGDYKDLILAVLPLSFICFTDFMNHTLDDEFNYKQNRLTYLGIVTVLSVVLLLTILLPFSFAGFAKNKASWISDFRYSWPTTKITVVGAVIFEILLGWVEALRSAARTLNKSDAATQGAVSATGQTGTGGHAP